jgi:hypothetical protein
MNNLQSTNIFKTHPFSHEYKSSLQELRMKKKQIICVSALLLTLSLLSGCWLLAAGGAGAYGGYKMKEEGYTLQNPVTKEKDKEKKTNQ